ncbi:DUF1801 domain-containing protein [Sphingoaurantiacus capsulatus]|uniref:DUF1801 domain-containing protein n=1 Tax=Sphingoaurantiacus capsulatus TaxID=1771310 RepID=A0ABV7X7W3_9SPHN
MTDSPAVVAWLTPLAPELRAAIDTLRAAVAAASPALVETIKWNAPSFALDGEDRATLNLGPKGSLRLILHRGARAPAGFSFDDPGGLAKWPSPDRGVLSFRDGADVAAKAPAVTDLVLRWLSA